MKNIIMATAVALLMVGCGDSAPECSDGDVKDLVLDISSTEMKRQVTSNPLYAVFKEEFKDGINEGDEQAAVNMYKNWENILSAADDLELIAIRTESTDEKTKKSTCKAQIKFPNEKTLDISYTVQMTSDGELFAEVYGL